MRLTGQIINILTICVLVNLGVTSTQSRLRHQMPLLFSGVAFLLNSMSGKIGISFKHKKKNQPELIILAGSFTFFYVLNFKTSILQKLPWPRTLQVPAHRRVVQYRCFSPPLSARIPWNLRPGKQHRLFETDA
jgi:hypothetical protein